MPGHNLFKANLTNRFIAKLLDFVILLLIAYPLHFLFVPVADVIALVYILCADAFPEGASPGKRMVHIRTVHTKTHVPCTVRQSLIRNIPFGFIVLFAIFPPALGYIFMIFVAVPLLVLECYLLFTLDTKKRLGDVIADTLVVDALDEDPEKKPNA
ncbi:MAG: RDD family protein [Deltaproteobacteria bacterium]|nr:RDD family protein [Deltaproteobacteria bacterium]